MTETNNTNAIETTEELMVAMKKYFGTEFITEEMVEDMAATIIEKAIAEGNPKVALEMAKGSDARGINWKAGTSRIKATGTTIGHHSVSIGSQFLSDLLGVGQLVLAAGAALIGTTAHVAVGSADMVVSTGKAIWTGEVVEPSYVQTMDEKLVDAMDGIMSKMVVAQ